MFLSNPIRTIIAAICGFLALVAVSQAAGKPAGEATINFEDHIKPIFREHCTTCHSEGEKEADLALDTYGAALSGGSGGEIIADGDSSGSRLIAVVTHATGPFMPPDQDTIPAEQIKLLKTWIDQGMPENSGSKIRRASSAATAMLSTVSTGKPEGPPPMPKSMLKQPITVTTRSSAVSAMAASPWAPLIAVGGQEQVVLYHADTSVLLGVIPFPEGEPQSITFTRDGRQILIGGGRHSKSGCAVLVDVETGKRITKVGDELDTVLAADISPDKSRIAIAGPQKTVRIFDSLTGDIVHELKKHTDWVFCLRYSPDGVLLASGDRSNGLVVWEADTGLLYNELKGHTGSVRAVDFRADSNILVSASLDGTLRTWEMTECKQTKSWGAHGGGATAVAFSQDGQIASSGRDRIVKLWDGAGKLTKEFKGLSEAGLEVAITGDARRIAAGDWNGMTSLWSAEAAKLTGSVAPNPPSITQRLAAAAAAVKQLEAPLAAAQNAAKKSQKQLVEMAQPAKQSKVQSERLAQSLTTMEATQKQLAASAPALAAKVAELEKQLAGARKAVADNLAKSQQATSKLADTQTQSQAASAAMAKHQQQHKELTAADNKAKQSLAEVQAKVQAAGAKLAAAQADQAAFDARAAELQERSETAATNAGKLTQLLSDSSADLEVKRANETAAAEKLAALEKQIDALTAQLASATSQREAAAAELSSKQKAAATLKTQLDQAEQTAAETSEELKLFNSAYRKN